VRWAHCPEATPGPDETIADQAAEIGRAILDVCSLRLTDIAVKMRGKQ